MCSHRKASENANYAACRKEAGSLVAAVFDLSLSELSESFRS